MGVVSIVILCMAILGSIFIVISEMEAESDDDDLFVD